MLCDMALNELTGAVARLTRSERLIDVALGVTAMALNIAGVFLPDETVYQYNNPNVPILVLIAAAPGFALIWRRYHPLLSMYVALAAMSLVSALGWQLGNLPGTLIFAAYAVGAWAPVRRGLLGLAGMHLCFIAYAFLKLPYFDEWIALATPIIFTLPWVLGAAIRRGRIAGQEAVSRALQLERETAIATERAVAEERLRMARELHDVVTHTLSIIAVQSGVARHLLPRSEDNGLRVALEVIETSSRDALNDLRRMLGLLRSTDGEDLYPSPGLHELNLLASAHRLTHGPVELAVDPAVEGASPGLRLSVFRVVQEALTNVGKHAPGAAARVAVRSSPTGVVIEIDNEESLNAPAHGHAGFGLAGMRERVALYGGTLDAGPRSDGGFRIRAELQQPDPV